MPSISDYIRHLLTQRRRIGEARSSHYDIDQHQKLLVMYRSLLAEYLRQHQEWERTEVPGFLSVGITMLRGHILEVKGRLRGWKIEVHDHPDDQGPNDDIGDEVQHQRNLLKIYRRNLATYIQQRQQFPPGQVPATLVNAIEGTQGQVQSIKAILGSFGVMVDDRLEEEIN